MIEKCQAPAVTLMTVCIHRISNTPKHIGLRAFIRRPDAADKLSIVVSQRKNCKSAIHTEPRFFVVPGLQKHLAPNTYDAFCQWRSNGHLASRRLDIVIVLRHKLAARIAIVPACVRIHPQRSIRVHGNDLIIDVQAPKKNYICGGLHERCRLVNPYNNIWFKRLAENGLHYCGRIVIRQRRVPFRLCRPEMLLCVC